MITAALALVQAASVPLEGPAADPQTCNDPVYLMVWIDNLDRSKSAAYGAALRETQIVRRNGGEYLMVSPPALVVEGDWPETRGFVIERYPCRAAFENMWFSAEYQTELIPLRAGSGEYTVALFEDWPPAAPAPAED
ncbi:MAG: DUF1330 domain-containing protein [Oceanicaulis sp.]